MEIAPEHRAGRQPRHIAGLAALQDLDVILAGVDDLREQRTLCEQVLETRKRMLGHGHPATLDVEARLAALALGLDEYSTARELYAELLERCERIRGPRNLDTLAAAHGLGISLSCLGRHDEARPLYERVASGRRKALGREDEETLAAMHNLALACRATGDERGARAALEALLDAQRRYLGPEHRASLKTLSTLGATLISLEEYKRAAEVLAERVDRSRGALGPTHPDTIDAMLSLARALEGSGDRAAARSLSERALTAAAAAFEPDDAVLRSAVARHAVLLLTVGEADEAIALYTDLTERCRRICGPEARETLDAIAGLAEASMRAGRAAPARGYFTELVDGRRRLLGPAHPATLHALRGLATALEQLGDVRAALVCAQEAADGIAGQWHADTPQARDASEQLARLLARNHLHADALDAHSRLLAEYRRAEDEPRAAAALAALAYEQVQVGRVATAADTYAELVALSERIRGQLAPDTLLAQVAYADALVAMGEVEAAKSIAVRIADPVAAAVESAADERGARDALALRLSFALGRTRELLDDLDGARAAYEKTLDGYVRTAARQTEPAMRCRYRLGLVAGRQGDPKRAHSMFVEVLTRWEEDFGAEDPETLDVMGSDADALADLGRRAAARNLAKNAVDGFRRVFGDEHPETVRAVERYERLADLAATTARRGPQA